MRVQIIPHESKTKDFYARIFEARKISQNMNQELVDYIKQQLNINMSKNKITGVLLEQGWHQSEIDAAFSVAEGNGRIMDEPAEGDPANDYGHDPGSNDSGGKRRTVLMAVSGLVIVAAAAGVGIFWLMGNNPAEPKKGSSAPSGNSFGTAPNDIVPVELTAEEKAKADQAREQVNTKMVEVIKQLEKSIEPPAGWELHVGNIQAYPLAVYVKPSAGGDKTSQKFKENISIVRAFYKATDITDEASFLAKARTRLSNAEYNYKIISETEVELSDGKKATLWEEKFKKDGTAMQGLQMYVFNGDHVFVLTGVALDSDWNVEKDIIKNSILTFKVPQ